MPRSRLLIVDDNDGLRAGLKCVFEDDYEITFASSGEEALRQLIPGTSQVVLMDYRMPGDLDGIETLARIKQQSPFSPVILMSAYDEIPTVVSALRQGAVDFVTKPFEVSDLKAAVDSAAASAQAVRQAVPSKPVSVREQAPMPVISQNEVNEMIAETLRLACV